jgi:hypothetical protein
MARHLQRAALDAAALQGGENLQDGEGRGGQLFERFK